jgi:integrase
MKTSVRAITVLQSDGTSIKKWQLDIRDASGYRQRPRFDTRREAEFERDKIAGQLRAGTFRPEAHNMTVSALAEKYIDYLKGRRNRGEKMTAGSFVGYEHSIQNYILATPASLKLRNCAENAVRFDKGIGAIRLSTLSKRSVEDFRDRLRDAGVLVQGARKIIGHLWIMLQWAKSQNYVGMNCAEHVEVIGRRDDGCEQIDPPTKAAMRVIIDEAEPSFKLQLLTSAATAVRAGELHAFRWRDIDFEKMEVKVVTRVDKYRNDDGQGPKTRAGKREIPIGATLIAALKAWRFQTRYATDDDLVFPNTLGRYLDHNYMIGRYYYSIWERLAEKHAQGLIPDPPPPFFNWHYIRHYGISLWIERALSIKAVQTFAGHASIQTTFDRYGHLFKSADHQTAMSSIADELFDTRET